MIVGAGRRRIAHGDLEMRVACFDGAKWALGAGSLTRDRLVERASTIKRALIQARTFPCFPTFPKADPCIGECGENRESFPPLLSRIRVFV